MIKFTYKGKTLAYMPTVGATVNQLKDCRDILADRLKLKACDIRLQFANPAPIYRF